MWADPESIHQGPHWVEEVARDPDGFRLVHARVELVCLRMAESEGDIWLAKNHITTAEVPARVESISFVHCELVLPQETEESDEHGSPHDHHDAGGPVDVWAQSHANEQCRCDRELAPHRSETQAL
jgi:hypothetical protein